VDHLGANVYYWGDEAQGRFLVEQVAPLARCLLAEGAAESFWFDSFDARGPHLMLLFTPGAVAAPALRERLRRELEWRLAAQPSGAALERAALEERHRQCRGKELCVADTRPGLADNDSVVLFDHPADGYPFSHARGLAGAGELWRGVSQVVLWALDRRAVGDAAPAAVRWTAAVDAALAAAGLAGEAYWRHHATTLVMPLAGRLAADEAAVLSAVPGVVGERNREPFAQLWQQVAAGGWDGPPVGRIVALAGAAGDGHRRWSLLREIVHTTLGQLGLPVRLHLPLVFYAWQRNLSLSPAA
jgi:hypothetical protein